MKSASPPSAATPAIKRRVLEIEPVRLAWNVGIAVGGVLLARLLGAVTQVVLTNRMSSEDYGLYTVLYTLLGVPIILSGLGLDTWLLRQAGMPETLRAQIRSVFSLRVFATIALMVGGGGLLLWSNRPGMTAALVITVGLGLTFEQLLTTAQSALRAQVRNQAAALLQVVAAALFIGLLWFWSSNAALPNLFVTLCRLAAATVGIGLMAWLLRDSVRLLWSPRAFWRLCVQARVFFAADLLAAVTLKADLTMIALMLSSTAASLYNPVLTIINTTFIVPSVAAQVLLPIIVRPNLPRREFRWIVGLSIGASVLYGAAWCGVLIWESATILTIFGKDYLAAAPLLEIMALIPLMKSLNFCSATVMVARDAQALRTKLQAAGAMFNLVGNLIVIPLFGLIGAAWVNLGTEAVLLVCYGWGAWTTRQRP